jgi:predicted phage terminase large subunit-like protein
MRLRGDWRKMKYKALVTWPDDMTFWSKWEEIYHDRTEGDTPEEATEISYRKAREFYEANKEAMDAGSHVLWPERVDLYTLMVLRATNRLAFASEMLNEPLDEDSRLFKHIHYYNVEDVNHTDLDFYYALDPSVGRNKRADFSSIMVIGKHRKTGIMYVIEADIRRRSPDRTIYDLFEKHKRYRFRAGWVESVAFQEFVRTEIQRRSAEAGLYIPADEFRTRNQDKDVRISGLEPLVNNGYVRFLPTQTLLLEMLEYFPRHNRKDGPDSLSMVVEGIRTKSVNVVFGTLNGR